MRLILIKSGLAVLFKTDIRMRFARGIPTSGFTAHADLSRLWLFCRNGRADALAANAAPARGKGQIRESF